jgi:HEAT repeat protein
MRRLGRTLRVNPGEERIAFRVLGMMVLAWAGFSIGGNAVEGLLFARFGPNALPYLFVTLGVATAAVMLGMNGLLARPRPQRLLLLFLPGMAVVILALRAVLLVHARWLYPGLWLVMMVLWTGLGVVTWGIAGAVHDTRQAKRLFPLYGAGLILGTAAGGVATAPLAAWLGAENLLLLWAAAVAASFPLARSALRAGGAAGLGRGRSRAARGGPSVWARVADGARSVRASPLLRWMSASLAVFAVLYFTLSLMFARAATARFPDANRLAGFLGLFMGISSGTALLVSLFVSNRLYARFGLATMVLALPVIYGVGFGVLALGTGFVPVAAFRFVQMLWVNGVWAGAWQAQYNVVPPERRDRTRAFVDGVALQAGVATAGVLLILAQTVLPASALPYIGLGAAVLGVAAAWQARRVYAGAVVDALRAGNPEVFPAEEPFGGALRDRATLDAARAASADPDPAVRRVAMEMLAARPGEETLPVVLPGLRDHDPMVRAAAVRGAAAGGALPEVAALLGDPEADVRLAALDALDAAGLPPEHREAVRAALRDPDAEVRARAAAVLLSTGHDADARETLGSMARSDDPERRAAGIAALAGRGDPEAIGAAVADPDPAVRRAAILALPEVLPPEAAGALVEALGDPDPDIRAGAAEGLVRLGDDARQPLEEALARPGTEPGIMRVLARLDGTAPERIRSYAAREVAEAVRYGDLLRRVDRAGDGRVALLAHSLRHRSLEHGVNALLVAGRLWDPVAIRIAVENLDSRDPGQRANALETLDAVGEPALVRPLVRSWEAAGASGDEGERAVADALGDVDPWIRACAAFAAGGSPPLRRTLESLASDDPVTLVRDAASAALGGDGAVETLASLSLMERIAFLLRVPLFERLSPADLERVAEIATEHVHADGDVIAEQGEPGDEMFVVVSGEISVVVRADGRDPVEVARRRAEESVGEMAVVSRAPRMATLVAAGDVRTLAIDRRRFERILRDRPDVALAVMGVLCSRLRESHGAEASA